MRDTRGPFQAQGACMTHAPVCRSAKPIRRANIVESVADDERDPSDLHRDAMKRSQARCNEPHDVSLVRRNGGPVAHHHVVHVGRHV